MNAPTRPHLAVVNGHATTTITRDGFVFLAMGFTGKEAAQWKEAYIEAFNAMEAALQQPAPPAADTLKSRQWGLSGAEHTAHESIQLARAMLEENGTAGGIKPARVAIITAVISLIEGAGAILKQERARLCHAMAAIDNSAIGEPDLYFGSAAQPSPEARAAHQAFTQLRAVKGGAA